MNKQIDVLYKIFELELGSPFTFVDDLIYPDVFNKFSERVAKYVKNDKYLIFDFYKTKPFFVKIGQTFNVDHFSDEDVLNVNKHLFEWLQNNFLKELEGVEIILPFNGKIFIHSLSNKPNY